MCLLVLTISASCCQLSPSVAASQTDSRYQGTTENVLARCHGWYAQHCYTSHGQIGQVSTFKGVRN